MDSTTLAVEGRAIYADVNILAKLFLNNSDTPQSREQARYAVHFPIQPEAINSEEAIISAEATIGSACYCRYSRIQCRSNNRLSLLLPVQQNTWPKQ